MVKSSLECRSFLLLVRNQTEDEQTYNEVRGFMGCISQISDEKFADGFLCGSFSSGVIRRKPGGDVRKTLRNVYRVGKIRKAIYLGWLAE